jgi:hypothetical protein
MTKRYCTTFYKTANTDFRGKYPTLKGSTVPFKDRLKQVIKGSTVPKTYATAL